MIKFDNQFFNIESTLYCGQLFRFRPFDKGYLVFSKDKACYLYYDSGKTVIESDNEYYFENYFDLNRDYSVIYEKAKSFNIPNLTKAAEGGKGIRILKQDRDEVIFSFIISQNNNIPRIKRTIEALSASLGDAKVSSRCSFYAFPNVAKIAKEEEGIYKSLGLGYRSSYILSTARAVARDDNFDALDLLSTSELRQKLMTYKGIGAKVADCILLFGFGRTDSFPVDTWIKKIYVEDFKGSLTDNAKISDYFVSSFGEYSGFIQQYLFYDKRGK